MLSYTIRPTDGEFEYTKVTCKNIDPHDYKAGWTYDTLFRRAYPISRRQLRQFQHNISRTNLDSVFYNESSGIATVRMNAIHEHGDTLSVECGQCPTRDSRMWLDAMLALNEQIEKDYETQCLDEDVKAGLALELPLEKVNDDPLEYRVWGNLYLNYQDSIDLVKFSSSLPKNEPIIFDMRRRRIHCNGKLDSFMGRVGQIYCLVDWTNIYSHKRAINANIGLDSLEILYGDLLQDSAWLSKHQEVQSEHKSYRKDIYSHNQYISSMPELQHYTSRNELMKALRSKH